MKVIIFGATGGIGKMAVKHALTKNHIVTAYVRSPEKLIIKHDNLTVIQGQINDYDSVYNALKGQDAVIWCVGLPMVKYEKMESLEGHEILIKAMDELKIKRLIDWGTPSISFSQDRWAVVTILPGIGASILFNQTKKELLAIAELIKKSDLDWTIVRFLMPKDTPYTGKVKAGFGDIWMSWSISREDIGAFMVEQLEDTKYVKSMPIIGS